MQCPQCKTELRIWSARYEVTGDNSPDTPTQLALVQELACQNPRCERYYGTIHAPVETVRTPLAIDSNGH